MADEKKKNPFKTRSLGRLLAFQALFQEELNPGAASRNWLETLDAYCVEEKLAPTGEERAEALEFARRLFEGALDRRAEVDALLEQTLTNRSLARTAAVDRNILRLAAYEMRFVKTPKAVVISQALELGKKFGEKETRAFLNGVLDQFE